MFVGQNIEANIINLFLGISECKKRSQMPCCTVTGISLLEALDSNYSDGVVNDQVDLQCHLVLKGELIPVMKIIIAGVMYSGCEFG